MGSTVECYDPQANGWKFVSPMNNQRDGACVATEGRYIYAISGYDGHSYLSSVEMYDPSSDAWASGGEIKPEKFILVVSGFECNDSIFICFLSLSYMGQIY